MRYSIDEKKKQPAYMQLYIALREDIVRGVYPFGVKLPSKRLLAAEIGKSVITVEHAYGILCDEGYVEAAEKSGYFVCYREQDVFPVMYPDAEEPAAESGKVRNGAASVVLAAEFSSNENSAEPSTAWEIPDETVRSGDQNREEQIPYPMLARTMRRVLSEYGEKILQRSPGNGVPELRSAIAAYLARSRGMLVDPAQIVIGSGSEYLYSLIVQLVGDAHRFALEDPSYEKIRRMYEANGVSCELLRMGSEGIEPEELRRSEAKVLHVTPFNSFPSGITASASRRRQYIAWAKSRNGIIIEDDFDSEFTVSSKAEDTLFSLEPERTVIYLNTFSKTIAPSIRIGYMVLPRKLVEVYRERIGFYSSTVPTFEQYVLTEMINSGEFERHINRVRRMRRKRS
ncbi:MAG: PLP-dependent aminotransferase family protein [Eubacteriales bacterium]|nr:PLP-dependent aminotransferase family protein [Eubacteriales bacterium]